MHAAVAIQLTSITQFLQWCTSFGFKIFSFIMIIGLGPIIFDNVYTIQNTQISFSHILCHV